MGWNSLLGKERNQVLIEENSGVVVDLVLVLVKGPTYLRGIKRNLT